MTLNLFIFYSNDSIEKKDTIFMKVLLFLKMGNMWLHQTFVCIGVSCMSVVFAELNQLCVTSASALLLLTSLVSSCFCCLFCDSKYV